MNVIESNKETKARKQHCCNFCGSKISIGEKYFNTTIAGDEGIYNWKTHKYCDSLAEKLGMYEYEFHNGEGITEEDFRTSVHEKYLDILRNKLESEGVKNHLSEVIRELAKTPLRDMLWYVIRELKKPQTNV